jgi:hypothetical protein
MTRPGQRGRAPRYRVVVYELHDDTPTKIMDATTSGFIAAAASIHNGEMDITLADGGSHDLQQHIALFINSQYRA